MSQPYAYPGGGAPSGGPPQLQGPGRPGPGYPAGPLPYPTTYPTPYPNPYPHPTPYPQGYPVPPARVPFPQPLRRPATVTMTATMTVTASLQFVCVLSFLWLVAFTGLQDFPNQGLNADAALYHLCRSFHLRMLDGLAWPLYLIPASSFVLGFLILIPRPWTRWALTLLGVGALAWSGVWLHRQIMLWVPAALYILLSCLLLWSPAASLWFRGRGRPHSTG